MFFFQVNPVSPPPNSKEAEAAAPVDPWALTETIDTGPKWSGKFSNISNRIRQVMYSMLV